MLICKVSLLCSALYTKCPYYLVLCMKSVQSMHCFICGVSIMQCVICRVSNYAVLGLDSALYDAGHTNEIRDGERGRRVKHCPDSRCTGLHSHVIVNPCPRLISQCSTLPRSKNGVEYSAREDIHANLRTKTQNYPFLD